jgi:3-hydroxyisobutyrate dehydrogenase-like beta-hydroxyacid dehydrogenase
MREQVRLGLIGFGEVGFNLAKGLHAEGLTDIAAFDPASGPAADLIAARAHEAGVRLVTGLAALAGRSDVMLGLTPGGYSLASAAALAPYLGPQHIYVDLASATPRVKTGVAVQVDASGVQFVDGSIMGAPLMDGHRVEIIASGPGAVAFQERLGAWGMNITALGTQPGVAAAIKIFRSVIAKGLEAVLVECLLATEQYGISAAVLDSYSRFLAPRPFAATAAFLVRTNAIHAGRRAEEAEMSAEALLDAGVEPIMTRATVARMETVAGLALRDTFGGAVPAHYSEAIAAVAAGLGVPTGVASPERTDREQ